MNETDVLFNFKAGNKYKHRLFFNGIQNIIFQ